MLVKNGKKGTVRGHSKNKNGFSRGGVVSAGKIGDAKMRVTIDTSKIHDKWHKCKSSKKHEKRHQKRAKIAQFLRFFS